MKYSYLGNTELQVSRICLGTMTFGEQNLEAEGHEQLSFAVDHGINFIDTAEMYSVPPREQTYGSTETIIGNWLQRCGKRDDLVIATKAAGPGEWLNYVRGGGTDYSKEQLREAVHGSLKRLQTDYIDLYQLHWPERKTNFFGQMDYEHESMESGTPFSDILETLSGLIREGKIRYIGVSNETPWGIHEFLKVSEMLGLPRVMSIQNPYSLLNRVFEVGLAEMAIREKVGLLAYSPLGFGVLSGKYLGGLQPSEARITKFPRFSRYSKPLGVEATQEYVRLARDHGLSPAQMALAFVNSRPFLTSNIIGATNLDQLKENIESIFVELPDSVKTGIQSIHERIPNPAP